MEPPLHAVTGTAERDADKDAKRKIQFSVPSSVPTQLDPRQVEMIRRRRPTPATLFRLTDPPSPEEDSGHQQWVLGENGVMRAKLVNTSTYQPPSLKDVQRMAQAHLSSIDASSTDQDQTTSGEEEEEVDKKSQETALDLRQERKALSDRSPSQASLTECHHHEEANDRDECKGE